MVGPLVCLYVCMYMYNKFCPSTIPCTLESSCLSVNSSRWNCDGDKREIIMQINFAWSMAAALGLWEGLCHSALLRSIVIVLKSSTWKCDGERESGTYVRYRTYAPFDSNCFEVFHVEM